MRSFLVCVFAVTFVTPSIASDDCDKEFVVSEVILQSSKLSPRQQAIIRAPLIGQCFDGPGVDVSQVGNTLRSFGYFDAAVPMTNITIVDASRHPQPVSLNVEIVEGARYKVREISWSGVKSIPMEKVIAISLIGPGDILDSAKLQQTSEAVRRLYVALGYSTALVSSSIELDEGSPYVSLHYIVAEGTQAR